MNCARYEFLSSASLASDQDSRIRGRDLRDFEKDVFDSIALTNYFAKSAVRLQLLPEGKCFPPPIDFSIGAALRGFAQLYFRFFTLCDVEAGADITEKYSHHLKSAVCLRHRSNDTLHLFCVTCTPARPAFFHQSCAVDLEASVAVLGMKCFQPSQCPASWSILRPVKSSHCLLT